MTQIASIVPNQVEGTLKPKMTSFTLYFNQITIDEYSCNRRAKNIILATVGMINFIKFDLSTGVLFKYNIDKYIESKSKPTIIKYFSGMIPEKIE